jgi:hypothetical protein
LYRSSSPAFFLADEQECNERQERLYFRFSDIAFKSHIIQIIMDIFGLIIRKYRKLNYCHIFLFKTFLCYLKYKRIYSDYLLILAEQCEAAGCFGLLGATIVVRADRRAANRLSIATAVCKKD